MRTTEPKQKRKDVRTDQGELHDEPTLEQIQVLA